MGRDKQFMVCMVIILGMIIGMRSMMHMRGEMQVVETRFHLLPHTIGEWVGVDKEFSKEVYDALRADENLYRIYTRPDGKSLGLYIGYYGTQRGGHPDHVPTGCYPGSGWGIQEIVPLSVQGADGAEIIVNNLYASKGDEAEQTLYWQQNYRGTVTHEGVGQNIEKLRTKLLYNRNDGALIRVNARVQGTREETIAFQKEFIRELLPLLSQCWPREEVRR